MYFKKLLGFVTAILLLNLSAVGDLNAAGIRVRCEARGTERSKVSVDGSGFPRGRYYAKISSGANRTKSRPLAVVGRQVEFDFDSEEDDVLAGATSIPATFIQNGVVKGSIRNAKNNRLMTSYMTAECRVRE